MVIGERNVAGANLAKTDELPHARVLALCPKELSPVEGRFFVGTTLNCSVCSENK